MAYTPSVAPDVTEHLPHSLARAQKSSSQWRANGTRFDVAIAGVAFQVAATDESQYQRETAPLQKEQIDASGEPGEQTLDGYWIRSQTSWHKGAGIRFYEPKDERTQYRFDESLGVDVWTEDKVTLLRAMVSTATTTNPCYATGAVVGGKDTIFTNEDGTVKRRDDSTTSYSGTTGASSPVVVAGKKILVGVDEDLYSGDASGNSLSEMVADFPDYVTPYWVKSRIIASAGPSLYELTLSDTTVPNPLFTHPDDDWKWTAVAEGPTSIYAAGYSNGRGIIYRFGLTEDTNGSTPKLSQPFQVLELPLGEEVHSVHVALGTYMGIGTSHGLRVALIQQDGTLALGPLVFETEHPVRAICSGDRFLYAAVEAGHPDGGTGAVRVDLSQETEENSLRFAYASDARIGEVGTPMSICMLGSTDRVVLTKNTGLWVQSATVLEESGYITSGRIRYGTVENKSFRTLSVGCAVHQGKVSVSQVSPKGAVTFIRTLSADSPDGTKVNMLTEAQEYVQVKLGLLRDDDDNTAGPILESYQVRALPAPRRQRLVKFPLLCMDFERSANGHAYGKEGFAWERVEALEEAEESQATVMVQDFTTGETYPGVIEKVSFRRPGPRSSDGRTNFGGYLDVVVRKL